MGVAKWRWVSPNGDECRRGDDIAVIKISPRRGLRHAATAVAVWRQPSPRLCNRPIIPPQMTHALQVSVARHHVARFPRGAYPHTDYSSRLQPPSSPPHAPTPTPTPTPHSKVHTGPTKVSTRYSEVHTRSAEARLLGGPHFPEDHTRFLEVHRSIPGPQRSGFLEVHPWSQKGTEVMSLSVSLAAPRWWDGPSPLRQVLGKQGYRSNPP